MAPQQPKLSKLPKLRSQLSWRKMSVFALNAQKLGKRKMFVPLAPFVPIRGIVIVGNVSNAIRAIPLAQLAVIVLGAMGVAVA